MRKRQAKKVMRSPTHREATYWRARRAMYPRPDRITAAFLDLARAAALGIAPLRRIREALREMRG